MKQLLLYYHTLRYLKVRQLFYQSWYRLKWRFFNFRYSQNFKIKLDSKQPWDLPDLYRHSNYKDHLSFTFLNRNKSFAGEIDWNFMEYGKLWHYHLQYMDYLLDESIPVSQRKEFIILIASRITNGNLKLEPYLVSMRLRNMLIFIQKFSFDHQEVNKSIGIQVAFLEHNLEYHLLANHLLENYISLCFAFVILKDEQKQTHYFKLLIRELKEQILPDGSHYERTPSYHAQILYHLFQLCYLLKLQNVNLNGLSELNGTCERMLGWLQAFGKNELLLINDSAKSTTPTVEELLNIATHCNVKPQQINLKDSGFRILKNDHCKMIINCGNITPSYQPGHAHADMLHFVLYFNGKQILVDTGVSTYESNDVRLIERSTFMHNTVSIGDENQSQVWASFRMAKRASVEILEEGENKITAEVTWHNGIRHKRVFNLSNDKLILEDYIIQLSDQKEMPAANFHFDHLLKDQLSIEKNALKLKDSGLEIQFTNAQEILKKDYFQAEDFNLRTQSVKISAYFARSLKTEFSWKP